MAKLAWDKTGERLYETGVDRVVLYKSRTKGMPWNGVTSINESPSGAEPTSLWANNGKYVVLLSVEELGLTIEAYTYPDNFMKCLGKEEISPGVTIGQQDREHFGLSYRTLIGNDENGQGYGYKIHLVYDGLASPTEKENATVNDSPDVSPFSWKVTTTPVSIEGRKPTAMITLDSTEFKKAGLMNALKGIEDALYGTEKGNEWLPLFSEIEELIEFHRYMRDSNGDLLIDSAGDPLQSSTFE